MTETPADVARRVATTPADREVLTERLAAARTEVEQILDEAINRYERVVSDACTDYLLNGGDKESLVEAFRAASRRVTAAARTAEAAAGRPL